MNKYSHLDNKIKELYLSGNSSPEIAKKLNIKSHSIVQRHLKKMDIELRSISESTKLRNYKGDLKHWSKGLTKENSEKIRIMARKNSIKQKGKKKAPFTEEHKRKIGLKSLGRKHTEESKEKLRQAHLGKKMSEETKKKMSKASKKYWEIEENKERVSKRMSGSKNYFWQGGISFEPYDKTFNNKIKREVRKRDNQVCMLCGIHREKLKRALDVHHINYDKLLSIKENLISLCKGCHTKTSFNRKNWTIFLQSLLSEKYNFNYLENKDIVIKLNEEISNEL